MTDQNRLSYFYRLMLIVTVCLISYNHLVAQTFVPMDGPYGVKVRSMAITDDGAVLVSCSDNERDMIYRWDGVSWQLPISKSYFNIASRFPIASRNDLVIAAKIDVGLYNSEMWRSSDGGVTWDTIKPNFGPAIRGTSQCFAFDNSDALLLGVGHPNDYPIGFGGLRRSTDSAKTWFAVGNEGERNGIDTANVMDIVVQHETLYVATARGFYRSINNGDSWSVFTTGMTNIFLYDILVTPNGSLLAWSLFGPMYKSTNKGETWFPISLGDDSIRRISLAVHPDGTVYALATYNGASPKVFRSINNGDTWLPNDMGLYDNTYIGPVVIDSESGSLYAGTIPDGVVKSDDGGFSWDQIGPPANITTLVSFDDLTDSLATSDKLPLSRSSGDSARNIMLALGLDNLFRSTDDGFTWIRPKVGDSWNGYLYYLTVTPRRNVFLIQAEGIYRSGDLGETWQLIPIMPGGDDYNTMAVDSRSVVYLGGQKGLYWSTDEGISWNRKEYIDTVDGIPKIRNVDIVGISRAVRNYNAIFVGCWNTNLIRRSLDSGTTWQEYPFPITWNSEGTLLISVDDSGNVFAGSSVDGIFKSSDDGLTWSPLGSTGQTIQMNVPQSTTPEAIISMKGKSGKLFAGTEQSGLFRSTDGGSQWMSVNQGLQSLTVPAVVIPRSNFVYVASGSGVYRSLMPLGYPDVAPSQVAAGWNMVSLPVKGRAKYAVSSLFVTSTSQAFGYHAGYQTSDYLTPGIGYWIKCEEVADVPFVGIPISRDTIDVFKGWNIISSLSIPIAVTGIASIPGGLRTSDVFSFDPVEGKYLIADTIYPGKGYWLKMAGEGQLILASEITTSRADLIRIVHGEEEVPPPPPGEQSREVEIIPKAYTLNQCYPNPFNPETNIRYQIPQKNEVTLKVYNVLGEVVTTLISGQQEPGTKSVTWDASALPSGVYFYRLTAGSFSETKKMVLMK